MENECIIFIGCVDSGGYGLKRHNGTLYKAHRLQWINHHGEIPDGLMVCHICDVRNCININHLFLGNNSDNMLDMYSKGRGNNKDKNIYSKKLNTQDAEMIRKTSGTHKDIAVKYGIDRTMVGKIKNGVCWG